MSNESREQSGSQRAWVSLAGKLRKAVGQRIESISTVETSDLPGLVASISEAMDIEREALCFDSTVAAMIADNEVEPEKTNGVETVEEGAEDA